MSISKTALFPLSRILEGIQGNVVKQHQTAKNVLHKQRSEGKQVTWATHWNVHVVPRACHTILAIGNIFAAVIDLCIGLLLALGHILTFGTCFIFDPKILEKGAKHLIAEPFKNVVSVLNPGAVFPEVKHEEDYISRVQEVFLSYCQVCAKSKNFLIKHGLYRISIIGISLISIAIRVTFLAVGLFSGLLSLLVLGNHEAFNKWAYYGLQFPKIIGELAEFLIVFFSIN